MTEIENNGIYIDVDDSKNFKKWFNFWYPVIIMVGLVAIVVFCCGLIIYDDTLIKVNYKSSSEISVDIGINVAVENIDYVEVSTTFAKYIIDSPRSGSNTVRISKNEHVVVDVHYIDGNVKRIFDNKDKLIKYYPRVTTNSVNSSVFKKIEFIDFDKEYKFGTYSV
jgi:hypothetical protein